jgi:hypothetical protein
MACIGTSGLRIGVLWPIPPMTWASFGDATGNSASYAGFFNAGGQGSIGYRTNAVTKNAVKCHSPMDRNACSMCMERS